MNERCCGRTIGFLAGILILVWMTCGLMPAGAALIIYEPFLAAGTGDPANGIYQTTALNSGDNPTTTGGPILGDEGDWTTNSGGFSINATGSNVPSVGYEQGGRLAYSTSATRFARRSLDNQAAVGQDQQAFYASVIMRAGDTSGSAFNSINLGGLGIQFQDNQILVTGAVDGPAVVAASYVQNADTLVVIRGFRDEGGNDLLEVWVNPADISNPGAPAYSRSGENFLQAGSARFNEKELVAHTSASWDEIRVATSWEALTGAALTGSGPAPMPVPTRNPLQNIAVWTFDTSMGSTGGGTFTFAPEVGDGLLTIADVAGGTNLSVSGSGGTLRNAPYGADATGFLNLERGSRWNNKTLDFSFSTEGLYDLMMSFDVRFSANGTQDHQIQYSWDGGDEFFLLDSFGQSLVGQWQTLQFDFTGIEELNDNPDVVVRLWMDGATGAASSTAGNQYDNFRFAGRLAPEAVIPEPTSSVLTLAGLAILTLARRRRSQGLTTRI